MARDPFRSLHLEYLEGARARLAQLHALRAAAGADAAALHQLRLLAHNLRGSGGFYGFHAISEAARGLEELVIAAQSGQPLADEALVEATQALARAVQEADVP